MGKMTREYVSMTLTSRIFGIEDLMTVAPRFSACIIFGLLLPSKTRNVVNKYYLMSVGPLLYANKNN